MIPDKTYQRHLQEQVTVRFGWHLISGILEAIEPTGINCLILVIRRGAEVTLVKESSVTAFSYQTRDIKEQR